MTHHTVAVDLSAAHPSKSPVPPQTKYCIVLKSGDCGGHLSHCHVKKTAIDDLTFVT